MTLSQVDAREQLPPNMMKRGDIYYVRAQREGVDTWRSTRCSTLKQAIKRSHEILAKLHKGELGPKPKLAPTFTEWSRIYQAVYSSAKSAPERDEQILTPARAAFGSKRLDEITKSFCISYLANRKVAGPTKNRERGTLQACFERAIDDGLIEKNPWKSIPREIEKPRVRVLTEENERKLRAVLSPQMNRWLTWMLETGLRIEECRGVGKDEIDFTTHLAHVPAESAKGGKSRSVPLSLAAEQAALEQIAEFGRLWHGNQQNYRQVLGGKGKPSSPTHVKGACARAGIPHLSPHDLRHTFATRYLRAGGDIFQLSKILGHHSVHMTERHYIHLLAEDLVNARRLVNVTGATTSATTVDQPKSTSSHATQMTLGALESETSIIG